MHGHAIALATGMFLLFYKFNHHKNNHLAIWQHCLKYIRLYCCHLSSCGSNGRNNGIAIQNRIHVPSQIL